MVGKRIIFLHIPKTAGQSIHSYLTKLISHRETCPARVNDMLLGMPINELRGYRIFSGHLDWSLLDCVSEGAFTFTVLREPTDRILSFYFYLRGKGLKLTREELSLPQNNGMRAAAELSCDDYFTAGPPMIRNFLDNHYDNFYMYYFAGRTYDSRSKLLSLERRGERSADWIMASAMANLENLSGVYTVDNLEPLEDALTAFVGHVASGSTLSQTRVNVGDGRNTDDRVAQLQQLGATKRTFDRLRSMTQFDDLIWKAVSEQGGPGRLTHAPV